MSRSVLRVPFIVSLTVVIFIIDFVTGLVPDVSGLYLIPVVLTTYWYGLLPGLVSAAVILSADALAHPEIHLRIIFIQNFTHLITYAFAAVVTATLHKQLATTRRLQERRDEELSIARQVQVAMGKDRVEPADEHFEIATAAVPARELGGDYIVVRHVAGGLFAGVADISGKGVSAAMFGALLQTQVDDALETSAAPENVIETVNAHMFPYLPSEIFITMFCCFIRDENLTFANAGHEPAFISSASGGLLPPLLSDEGMPIGIKPRLAIEPKRIRFASGSILLCFSDGITDSDGFGRDNERVREFFAERIAMSAEELCGAITRHAADERPQPDDMTVLVVRAV